MKRFIILILAAALLFSSCASGKKASQPDYKKIDKINHYAVEPDKAAAMDENDQKYFHKLVDAMLDYKDSVKLNSNNNKNNLYLNALKQSPYYFLVKDYTISDRYLKFTYNYTKEEHKDIIKYMDEQFLDIINCDAEMDDNSLDTILKIYGCVAKSFEYDHDRTEDFQLDMPIFTYPSDEVYNTFQSKKGVCFSFAYILNYSLLQAGIESFCIHGNCHAHNQAHMWNIFKYDGEYFNCDVVWDRGEEKEYAKLYHFGKTDAERTSDTLTSINFAATHYPPYAYIKCTDKRFSIFRGIKKFSYISNHKFLLEDFENNEKIFDTEAFTLE